ncbi:xyloside xylosyltransferase 1-like [Ornithodoros turicata]|uniref:xyloside xylosyltransferase 1-like n=1 Tax=Ornithodoros turicata TaxID=34597 RepID=UPI003138E5EE
MTRNSVCNVSPTPSVTKAVVLCCLIGAVLIIYSDHRSLKDARHSNNSSRNTSSPRILARFQLNTSHNSTFQVDKGVVNIFFVFMKARSRNLREKLAVFSTSLFERSTVPLHLHVVTDTDSQEVATQVLQDASALSSVNVLVDILHIADVLYPVQDMMQYMQAHFSPQGSNYYSDPLFLLSLGLHRVFDSDMRVIILDIDTRVESDISLLNRHFSLFGDTAVMGIALEQQPVYRHALRSYRKHNPKTKCGEAPGRGFPGFNSGVVLLDIGRIRSSAFYQSFLREQAVRNLTAKYSFSGGLGDQDFYTLLACEHPELFYVLPCTWNRQLCKYWNEHGYSSVFDDYHNCPGEIHLYHGNCNSPIPGRHLGR